MYIMCSLQFVYFDKIHNFWNVLHATFIELAQIKSSHKLLPHK